MKLKRWCLKTDMVVLANFTTTAPFIYPGLFANTRFTNADWFVSFFADTNSFHATLTSHRWLALITQPWIIVMMFMVMMFTGRWIATTTL
jgi:hypothetical protein